MSEHQVNDLLGVTMDKVKQMVDVNTVMGEPVIAPDGTIVIPVSRVSYGFAGGGSDLPTKKNPEQATKGLFLGGSGAAVTVNPIAFLTIREGSVRVLQIEPYFSPVDRAIEKVPDVVDQVTALFGKKKDSQNAETDKKTQGDFDKKTGA